MIFPPSDSNANVGIDNVEFLSIAMRQALEKAFTNSSGQLSKMLPEEADKAKTMQANIVDMVTKKEAVTNLVSRMPVSLNYFAGGGLDPAKAYEFDDKGANPFGGEPFPMKTHIEISLDDGDPGYVTAIWIIKLDSEKGANLILELTEKMIGEKLDEATRKKMSNAIDITNRVDYRIELATGIVQEMTRVEIKSIVDRRETKTITMVLRKNSDGSKDAVAAVN